MAHTDAWDSARTHITLEFSKRKHSLQLQKQPLLHMHKPFTNNSILVIKTLGFWSKAFNTYLVASTISDDFHSLHCQWRWEDCYAVVEARYSSSSSLSPPSLLFCNKKNSAWWWFYCSRHLLAAHCITTDIINVQAADGTLMLIITTNCFALKTGIQHWWWWLRVQNFPLHWSCAQFLKLRFGTS